jgi:hypothetical protein
LWKHDDADGGALIRDTIVSSLLIGMLFALAIDHCQAARIGPRGRIRTICFGDVIDQYGGFNSFVVIREDPAIQTTFIPSRPDYLGGRDDALRNMRMYMPRLRSILVEDYEIMLFSDADRSVFRSDWIGWISDSVPEDGMGLLWLGLIADNRFDSWEDTTVAEILPAQQSITASGDYLRNGPLGLNVADTDEPLMRSLPWESSPPLDNVNVQVARQGAHVWATVRNLRILVNPTHHPLISFWGNGEGVVLTFASKFPNGVMPWADRWDFFPQAVMYLVYRVAEKEIPMNPHLFLRVITEFMEFSEMNSVLLSLLSWVDKFGGTTDRLHSRIEDVRQIRMEAYDAYMAADLEEAIGIMEAGRAEQESIRDAAMRAKDQALIWVYVIEWLSLISTMMVSGFIVWTLMVRRRMYREVGVTRWDW